MKEDITFGRRTEDGKETSSYCRKTLTLGYGEGNFKLKVVAEAENEDAVDAMLDPFRPVMQTVDREAAVDPDQLEIEGTQTDTSKTVKEALKRASAYNGKKQRRKLPPAEIKTAN